MAIANSEIEIDSERIAVSHIKTCLLSANVSIRITERYPSQVVEIRFQTEIASRLQAMMDKNTCRKTID